MLHWITDCRAGFVALLNGRLRSGDGCVCAASADGLEIKT